MMMLCSNKGKNYHPNDLDNENNNIVMEEGNIIMSSEFGATNSNRTTGRSLEHDRIATSLRLG